MKSRLISAFIMFLICVPIFIIGGNLYNFFVVLLGILALKEFLDMKETKKKLPLFVKFISYIFLLLFIILNIGKDIQSFSVDNRILTLMFITFFVPTILYHDRELYSVNDAFFMLGSMFFLSLAFILLIDIRSYSILLFIYLLLITILTDTFALFIGKLIGSHELVREISPNKTIEGTIGGSLVSIFVSSVFYITVISNENILKTIILTSILSILAQFGDLFFSSIKRYYGKKDFSNLIPGHGGILDRLDSIIFVLLGFMLFISI